MNLEQDLDMGFEKISSHGCFEKKEVSTLSFSQSLELMENWLTCRGLCLLQLRNQLGVAIEQKQALEVINCTEVEKNFFFGALKRAFKVLVIHEKQMSSHVHLALSHMGVVWLEAEGSFRDASLISLLVGEKTPRRRFKKKKLLIENCPPLKLIFTDVGSQLFPSVELGYGFQVDLPESRLHPEAWVKVLASSFAFDNIPVPCPQIPLCQMISCPHEALSTEEERKSDTPKVKEVDWEDLESLLKSEFEADQWSEQENTDTFDWLKEDAQITQDVEMTEEFKHNTASCQTLHSTAGVYEVNEK